MISFVAFVVWDGVLWWCPGCPKPVDRPCLLPWHRIRVCHSGLYPVLCRLAPLPRTLLPVLWESSAYPALKSPGPRLPHAQPLWPGKSVWLMASLSPQKSASLELLQTGGPATTTAPSSICTSVQCLPWEGTYPVASFSPVNWNEVTRCETPCLKAAEFAWWWRPVLTSLTK